MTYSLASNVQCQYQTWLICCHNKLWKSGHPNHIVTKTILRAAITGSFHHFSSPLQNANTKEIIVKHKENRLCKCSLKNDYFISKFYRFQRIRTAKKNQFSHGLIGNEGSGIRFFSQDVNSVSEKCLAEKHNLQQLSDKSERSDDALVLSRDNHEDEKEDLLGVHEADSENRIINTDENRESSLERHESVNSLSLPELARRKPATLAPYVNRSETLQRLVQLGVDLSVVQQVEGMSSLLVCSKFDRDIAPYINFLFRAGVPSDKLGHILTVNPHILTTPMEELEIRVGYLVHHQFTLPQVGSMCARAPVILLMSPEQMDAKLGFLQQTFDLTADELRQVVDLVPSILPYKKVRMALSRFQMKSFMGFEDEELKQVMIKEPRVYMTKFQLMLNNFEYLQNIMSIPHDLILAFPRVLLHRIHHMRNRHLFLLSRRRAQYDPYKENYVSLTALVIGSDQDFCENIAKCDLKTYYDFLKTL